MKVFNGIPKKRIIIDALLASVWSLMNARFSNSIAVKFSELINGNPITDAIIYFTVFIVMWELLEIASDIYNHVSCSIIESNINKLYFNKLYEIKPSVLKSYNTGYISGLLNKLVVRQEQAYSHMVLSMPISVIYTLYFSVIMWQKHWSLGVLMIVIVLIGNILRFSISSIAEKYSEELFLLDESTSNVDEEIEKKMVKLIQDTLYDKTVVIITHRPMIKGICDKFYKFENSTLIEVPKSEALKS